MVALLVDVCFKVGDCGGAELGLGAVQGGGAIFALVALVVIEGTKERGGKGIY